MKTFILSGLYLNDNFGCPSILHGMEETLRMLYGDDIRVINYQTSSFNQEYVTDFTCENRVFLYTVKEWLPALMKEKFGIRTPHHQFFSEISNADMVIDLFGICFCDSLLGVEYKMAKPVAIWKCLNKFTIAFIAKRLGKATYKNTASFGPMIKKTNRYMARYSSRRIFDSYIAREKTSQRSLMASTERKNVLYAPDVANMMPYICDSKKENLVGISISHQIVRQWNGREAYANVIAELCKYIIRTLGLQIILIPNEWADSTVYNDVDVARDISLILSDSNISIETMPVSKMTSTQIKNRIAECAAIVASRYHTCVAALSSGVPTLVIGWHDKYQELMNLYQQGEWLLTNENCSSDKLIRMFEEFWSKNSELTKIIKLRRPEVQRSVLETARQQYGHSEIL